MFGHVNDSYTNQRGTKAQRGAGLSRDLVGSAVCDGYYATRFFEIKLDSVRVVGNSSLALNSDLKNYFPLRSGLIPVRRNYLV
ncbi:MAG: hypothetical protein C5B58_00895 [Acidobacteria bacterium]|nr:MAG: hypothetical protein C5B58_00895 [Acidobacteriota bacterium]